MAKSFTISMILQMVNKVAGPAAAVIGALNKIDDRAKRAAVSLASMGEKMQNTGKKMMGSLGGTAALIAPVVGALKVASTWEDSLAKISTMTKMTTAEVRAKWQKDFFAIARETGADLDDIGEAAYQALSAAVPEEKLTGFLRTAVLASKVGFTTTLQAVDGMTSAMNAFGVSAEQAGNMMMAAQIKGKTTIGQIAGSIGQIGPIAASMGMKFEEVQAALAGMTQTGSKTEEAFTGIRSILVSTAKQTEQQQKALAKLGIQFSTDTIRQFGFIKSLQIVDRAARANSKTQAEYAAILNDVFGRVEGLNAAFALTSGKGLAVYNDTINMITTDTKLMERAQEQMGNKASANWKKLKNEIKIFSIEVGTSLLPALKDAFSGVFDLIRSMRDAIEASYALKLALQILAGVIFGVIAAVKLAGVAVWAAGYAMKFAAIMTKVWRVALIALRVVITALRFAMLALKPVIMMLFSPAGLLIVGIGAAIALIILMIVYWDKVKAAMKSAGDAVWDHFLAPIGNAFKALWEWMKSVGVWFYDLGVSLGKSIGNGIVDGAKGAVDWVKDKLGIGGSVSTATPLLRDLALPSFTIPSATRPTGNAINVTLNGGINVTGGSVADIGRKAWDALKPTLETEIDKMNRQKSRRGMGDK
jgi:TP901 family phage tail tape measure protein